MANICKGIRLFGSNSKRKVIGSYHCYQHIKNKVEIEKVEKKVEKKVKRIPRNKIINKQEKVKYVKEIKEKIEIHECPICLEDIMEKLIITNCGHKYHMGCLGNIRSLDCPMCRTRLHLPKDIEIKIIQRIARDKVLIERENFDILLRERDREVDYNLLLLLSRFS